MATKVAQSPDSRLRFGLDKEKKRFRPQKLESQHGFDSPGAGLIRSALHKHNADVLADVPKVPNRYLKAAGGNPTVALRRYRETLLFRSHHRLDSILDEPSPHFSTIKKNYPHFFHLTGHQGEPCFYEKPAQVNHRALRKAGVSIDAMYRHRMMATEVQWKRLYPNDDDLASIYIADLQGIRLVDFSGEAIELLQKVASFSKAHHPGRTGKVFVVNAPDWFHLIWNVLKTVADPETLSRTSILRNDKEHILAALQEYIPVENIPAEYGGTSVKLGHSPEEVEFARLVARNNERFLAELSDNKKS